jgi:hypothetical protein
VLYQTDLEVLMYRVALRLSAVVPFVLFTACENPVGPSEGVSHLAPAAAAALNTTATTVLVHEKVQLRTSATLSRSRSLRWKSSNSSVAKVNSNGIVEGVLTGDVNITAVSSTGAEESFPVSVQQVALVQVSAPKTDVQLGERIELKAIALTSGGLEVTSQNPTVWSVASGSAVTVSSEGAVTGIETGTAMVTATVAGVTGPLMLTVGNAGNPDDPSVTAFSISPKPASVVVGGQLQMSTSVTWSDAASRPIDVTYTATGGTIDLNGLYRAGQVAGAFSIVANCACGRSDTSTVTVLASNAAATLTALRISPKPVSLPVSSSQQFAIQAVWSDGVERAATVAYSATGGSVSNAGLYTAPPTAGTYRVVVSHTGGTLKDTAVVTVNATTSSGGSPTYVAPALPSAFVQTSYPALTGVSRIVNAGGNLQAALDAAQPGDEVVLANGATFTGNFVLPAKSGAGWIVVRSATVPSSAGVRVSPTSAASVARIVSPNSGAAIRTADGAKRWRLVGLHVTQAAGLSINYGLVVLGMGDESTRAKQPSNIILDRMYIHGTANDQLKRCVTFNGDSLAVIDSWLSECHGKGFDSQGVAGWSGLGPFLIENNRIEGAGQAIMFGGADPTIANISPSDIVIRRNHLYKPLSWGNGLWTVKATFELKHAKRVLFEGNVLENHWADAQVGFAILLQGLSDQNTAWEWTTVSDITIQNNVIKNSRSALNVHARMMNPGGTPLTNPSSRLLIRNNLFQDVGRDPFSGSEGLLVQLLGDIRDMTILNNTFTNNALAGSAIMLDGLGQQRLTVVNNVFSQTRYGLFGNEVGVGMPALNTYAIGATVTENVFPGEPGESAHKYPAGNYFPQFGSSIQFASSGSGNFELLPSNAFFQGAFGRIGLNNSALQSAVAGVVN